MVKSTGEYKDQLYADGFRGKEKRVLARQMHAADVASYTANLGLTPPGSVFNGYNSYNPMMNGMNPMMGGGMLGMGGAAGMQDMMNMYMQMMMMQKMFGGEGGGMFNLGGTTDATSTDEVTWTKMKVSADDTDAGILTKSKGSDGTYKVETGEDDENKIVTIYRDKACSNELSTTTIEGGRKTSKTNLKNNNFTLNGNIKEVKGTSDASKFSNVTFSYEGNVISRIDLNEDGTANTGNDNKNTTAGTYRRLDVAGKSIYRLVSSTEKPEEAAAADAKALDDFKAKTNMGKFWELKGKTLNQLGTTT